ncbi:MAG: hypothetical protein KME10_29520 [Plectolyngbya sp. WJT66-NPBG17]|nr:hypothetical protein [Plectolyngbya sp. WJT66-NPBG17]MBW4529023.1 hypothetical protein [Phormidium tanganyikae FI6-MK23]
MNGKKSIVFAQAHYPGKQGTTDTGRSKKSQTIAGIEAGRIIRVIRVRARQYLPEERLLLIQTLGYLASIIGTCPVLVV